MKVHQCVTVEGDAILETVRSCMTEFKPEIAFVCSDYIGML